MRVWVTNAYDSTNLGDDFLLRAVLRRAMLPTGPGHEVTIVSNNPQTLGAIPYRSRATPGARRARSLSGTAWQGAVNFAGAWPTPAGHRPDAIVAMAGGYTAFTRPGGALMYFNDHFVTVNMARRYRVPAIMFPVSVGPIWGPSKRRLLGALGAFHTVMVRDDESAAELAALDNVIRVPDLAVQEIARIAPKPPPHRPTTQPVNLIARGLEDESPTYPARLARLAERTGGRFRLQVGKDEAFYLAHQLPCLAGPLDYDTLSARTPVTVSVRLHGALMSLLAGVPAIHLSYDRKGAGAYGDLGLSEWLHTAADFDPDVVAAQAAALVADPTPYFDALADALPRLTAITDSQDERVRDFWSTARARLASA